jgi:hypothetical protein
MSASVRALSHTVVQPCRQEQASSACTAATTPPKAAGECNRRYPWLLHSPVAFGLPWTMRRRGEASAQRSLRFSVERTLSPTVCRSAVTTRHSC